MIVYSQNCEFGDEVKQKNRDYLPAVYFQAEF